MLTPEQQEKIKKRFDAVYRGAVERGGSLAEAAQYTALDVLGSARQFPEVTEILVEYQIAGAHQKLEEIRNSQTTTSGSAATDPRMGAATGMNAPATLKTEMLPPAAPAPKLEQPEQVKTEPAPKADEQHSTTGGPSQTRFTPAASEFVKPSTGPLALVPAELKAKRTWVRWQLEAVDKRLTKVPYQLNGKKASSTDPSTWNTYEAVVAGAVINENQGIGIVTDGTFAGFDLDGCRNPATGEITPWAKRVIDLLGTYTEITPSGTGVRVLAFGKLPDGARKFSLALSAGHGDKVQIECYCTGRYFTVTGNRVGDVSSMQSSDGAIAEAHALCAEISREFPSEKRKQASQFSGSDSGSSVEFTQASSTVVTSKLAVLMYGTIVSNRPFEIQDEHGNKVTAPSQSEADMSLATLLAMKHGDNPELIDADFQESALHRTKWDRLAESQIAKAVATAQRIKEQEVKKVPVIEIPAVPATATPTITQAQADSAAKASQDAEGSCPYGEQIPDFDESVIVGSSRDLVDAICGGTTIPRQYALHGAKALACSIMTRFNVKLENCEGARAYFVVFGETGTGKGLAFRRMRKILNSTNSSNTIVGDFVKIVDDIDSDAGLRDAFLEIPLDANVPLLFFVDEVKKLGEKSDSKKNPEIVSAIVELANKTNVGRMKAKHGNQKAAKARDNCFLLVYACAQDGEAFATAFPRTKKVGLPDRFLPEYSPKIEPGDLPDPDATLGIRAIKKFFNFASQNPKMTATAEVKAQVNKMWATLPPEFRLSSRLRQQFLLEAYLAAFFRGSAIAEQQDLDVALKTFERQKAMRLKFFADEMPNQVGVFQSRLRVIREDMLRRLRRGAKIIDVALSVRDLMTQTLAYKENDLPNFNQAWKAQAPFWVECSVICNNGHAYKKWIPVPEETDMWLPTSQVKGPLG